MVESKYLDFDSPTKEATAHAIVSGASSQDVAVTFNVDKATVSQIFERFKARENVMRLPKSRRLQNWMEKDACAMVRLIKADSRMIAINVMTH